MTSAIGTSLSAEMGAGDAVIATGNITTANMMDHLHTTTGGSLSGTTYTFDEEAAVQVDLSAALTDATLTLVGTDRDGRAVTETLDLSAGTAVNTTFQYKTMTSMTANAALAAGDKTLSFKMITTENTFTYRGGREFGHFIIGTTADPSTDLLTSGSRTVGDIDTQDYEFGVSGLVDSGTVQGTIALSSSKIFSVTQQGTENSYSGGPQNDNYFTTKSAALSTVSNICLLYTSPSPRDLSTSRMPSSA